MSGHAEKLRRKAEADAALKTGYYEHADVLALLAEVQRYEKALVDIEARWPWPKLVHVVREALAGDAECVCGETNTRHCPVHGQGDTE